MSILKKIPKAPSLSCVEPKALSGWINAHQTSKQAINLANIHLNQSSPNHVVLDDLFLTTKLDQVLNDLSKEKYWQRQRHTYSHLYVDSATWQNTEQEQRFVQRDVWQRPANTTNTAIAFLEFIRSAEFMAFVSQIFDVAITDLNVADAQVNSNYFRLGCEDFVEQHADDSPGREVCMLLYLNKSWRSDYGGDLSFLGLRQDVPIKITPRFNRCVLFRPDSKGSEHWVDKLATKKTDLYRYNLTSWYWSE
ncbi:MAG: SM-20-related protein [Cryomorphaceae bacterium]|jgi:SM-20-related protein